MNARIYLSLKAGAGVALTLKARENPDSTIELARLFFFRGAPLRFRREPSFAYGIKFV